MALVPEASPRSRTGRRPGRTTTGPNLTSVLSTRTINWDLIRQQYDRIVKYTGRE
ncbi:hypothetical protein [Streptosporangium carneum]|uniref:Uncharacterized protein n=1 Tax=Streptosporangium carneum TaxID=47481 RepID=A0A9W6MCI6_9ACTN|nr:hypothetical protein [Streptosporangium carneum]GLK09191.1 hypothetical protein GCM10017600_25970 [Streptosporangium carneum]